jgi:hypothetical protein
MHYRERFLNLSPSKVSLSEKTKQNKHTMFPRPALLISLVLCFILAFVGFRKQIKTLIPSDPGALSSTSTSYLRDVLPKEAIAVITSVAPVINTTKNSDELISSISIKDEFDKINNKLDMTYDLLKVKNYKFDNITSSLTLVENTARESEQIVNSAENKNNNSPSMKRALECLRQTKSELPDLPYPKDAFQHFQEIHQRLDKWAQHANHKPHHAAKYEGPWIENTWISHFQKELQSKNNSLSDVFGPYIPIFIPWTDIWVNSRYKYPERLVLEMMKEDLLRDDVMYITVNQNDDGFVGRCSEFSDLQSRYHITVLSAGGYGHVPIPLLKQPEPSLSKVPPSERKHFISYVGSNKNAPEHMRQIMISQGNHYYHGEKWRNVMAQSKFQLCPRGYGRTSYHIQVGRFMIYLSEQCVRSFVRSFGLSSFSLSQPIRLILPVYIFPLFFVS